MAYMVDHISLQQFQNFSLRVVGQAYAQASRAYPISSRAYSRVIKEYTESFASERIEMHYLAIIVITLFALFVSHLPNLSFLSFTILIGATFGTFGREVHRIPKFRKCAAIGLIFFTILALLVAIFFTKYPGLPVLGLPYFFFSLWVSIRMYDQACIDQDFDILKEELSNNVANRIETVISDAEAKIYAKTGSIDHFPVVLITQLGPDSTTVLKRISAEMFKSRICPWSLYYEKKMQNWLLLSRERIVYERKFCDLLAKRVLALHKEESLRTTQQMLQNQRAINALLSNKNVSLLKAKKKLVNEIRRLQQQGLRLEQKYTLKNPSCEFTVELGEDKRTVRLVH